MTYMHTNGEIIFPSKREPPHGKGNGCCRATGSLAARGHKKSPLATMLLPDSDSISCLLELSIISRPRCFPQYRGREEIAMEKV